LKPGAVLDSGRGLPQVNQIIRRCKLKQVELAKKAGITEGMVSFILSGERRPSIDVAEKLAEATGTDPILWMKYNIKEMLKAVKDAD
jgi:transcriptional regulator with XRE-family HTH domain